MTRFSSLLIVFAVIGLLILSGLTLLPQERTSSQRQSNPASTPASQKGEQQAVSQNSSLPAQAESHQASSQSEAGAPSPPQAAAPSSAQDEGDLRELTIKQLVNLSTRIVLAKCRAVNVGKSAGGNIFTFSEFEVIRVLKGELRENSFTLRLLGGRIGDVEVSSEFVPKFTPETEVLLFLGRDNVAGYPTVFPQGVFQVLTAPSDQKKFITPKPEGLPLFRAQDQQPYITPPESLPLEDFLFSLQKLISGK